MGKQIEVMVMEEQPPSHAYSRSSVVLMDLVEKERKKGKKPVALGDANNTIIFIDERKNSERAAKSFVERVDENRTSYAKGWQKNNNSKSKDKEE
jgi:hypothetical protein